MERCNIFYDEGIIHARINDIKNYPSEIAIFFKPFLF